MQRIKEQLENEVLTQMKKVVIANDHGAVELASKIKKHLEERGYEVNWLGTQTEESVDYPDQAEKACIEFRKGGYEFGVLCCGTGIGISIAANKMKGIRCALIADKYSAEMTKRHNNPQFIAFGGRVNYHDSIESMLDAFIDHDFEDGRHSARIAKMMLLSLNNLIISPASANVVVKFKEAEENTYSICKPIIANTKFHHPLSSSIYRGTKS